jgi:predicted AlkP superfamily pyrophosphatase or phosphodiesterase
MFGYQQKDRLTARWSAKKIDNIERDFEVLRGASEREPSLKQVRPMTKHFLSSVPNYATTCVPATKKLVYHQSHFNLPSDETRTATAMTTTFSTLQHDP